MINLSRRFMLAGLGIGGAAAFACVPSFAQTRPTLKVPGDYKTVGEAFAALSDTGGVIELSPGTYREKLNLSKPDVHIKGMGKRPEDVVIVWGDGASTNNMGTFKSSSLTVSGDGFRASNLTIQNDYHLNNTAPSQAVALSISSDRAVLENVRLLGAQDTLYASSHKPALPSRQYYKGCYIEGHVDFIFGNALSFFDRCHIHIIARENAFITAHSRTSATETTAYVFDHCRITTEGDGNYYFGRAWRPYGQVVFLDSQIDGRIHPEGWREWTPGKTETYTTAAFAEYGSTGPGGDMSTRVFWAQKLTAEQAQKWRLESVFPDRSWIGN
jgi:pectinesterase